MTEPTPEQHLLSTAALTTFRLNGQFLGLADGLARPAGLTAAWWQVLGSVLREPLPVSAIAREMGLARQSVQRIADLLVDRDLATYRDNPAHRRAKLLVATDTGVASVRRISPAHAEKARALIGVLGPDRAREVVAALEELSAALQAIEADPSQ